MSLTREAGFGPEVKRRIILGTYALSVRLLRRVLRPGAEGAHADRAATSRPRSSRPTCWSRRPRRSSRSRSATRTDDPWRCTWPTCARSRPTSPAAPAISVPCGLSRGAAGRAADHGAGAGRRPDATGSAAALEARAPARPPRSRAVRHRRSMSHDRATEHRCRTTTSSSRYEPVIGLETHVELGTAYEDVLRLPDRRSAPSRTPRSARSASACPARCRWPTRPRSSRPSGSGWR